MHGAIPAFHGQPQPVGRGDPSRDRDFRELLVRRTGEQPAGGPQAARFADTQVGGLHLCRAAVAEGQGKGLDEAGAAFVFRFADFPFGHARGPGADLQIADLALAQAAQATVQFRLVEVLRHEAQGNQHQQGAEVETPAQP